MRRFHAPLLPDAGTFVLADEEGDHLVRVLRARPGDEVLVFDGRGREARCRVAEVSRRGGATLEVVAETVPRRALRDVAVAPAVPRGERMEWLVEKCTEAGVSAVFPWAAERSVRERASEHVLRRWRRAALEACKQCGRADVPFVSEVLPLGGAVAAAAGRAILVADPAATERIGEVRGGAERVTIFVGPEGGLTEGERSELAAAGARPFALGPLVLRIETAAVVAVHLAAN